MAHGEAGVLRVGGSGSRLGALLEGFQSIAVSMSTSMCARWPLVIRTGAACSRLVWDPDSLLGLLCPTTSTRGDTASAEAAIT